MFNGSEDYIAIPKLELTPPSTEFAFGYTMSAWVYLLDSSSDDQAEQLATLATQKQQKQQRKDEIEEELTAPRSQKQQKENSITTISEEITAQEQQKQAKELQREAKISQAQNPNTDQAEVVEKVFRYLVDLMVLRISHRENEIPPHYEGYLANPPQVSEENRQDFIGTLATDYEGDFATASTQDKLERLISRSNDTIDRQRVNDLKLQVATTLLSDEIEELQTQITTIEQTISNKQTQIQQLQAQITTIEQTISNKQTQIQQLQAQITTIEEQEEAIRNKKSIIVGEKGNCFELIVANSKVSLRVKFADGDEQVTDTADIATGQWVQYAGVIASDGASEKTTLTLFKNGQQVGTAKEVTALPETPESWQPEFLLGKTFTGKIADVQIWDKVRTAKEIKDSMYLQLTGREVDLEGYWRLGAISEGKERKVVDFSANANDGIVYGNAFISAITLKRTLGDNTTQVVKYSNDDLVAVSARATYVETFEFKTDPNVNPNDVDGDKLFGFSYWGKKSRSSETKITFSGTDSDFESLDNNWYKATCRITIPDGVAMMRTFELGDVKGTWSTLEIRKHRVQLLSDSITEVKYTDSLSLSTLAAQFTQLPGQLKTLEQKEREEAKLIREKWELEDAIARINNLPLLRQQIKVLEKDVDDLKQEEVTLKNQYHQELANPLNYECYLSVKVGSSSWKGVSVHNQSNSDDQKLVRHTGSGNLCRFSRQGDGNFAYLEVQVGSSWKGVHVYQQSDSDEQKLVRHTGCGNLFEIQKTNNNNYYLWVKVGSSRKGVHVYKQYDSDNQPLIRHSDRGNLFSINKTNNKNNDKIKDAQTAWNEKITELTPKQKELTKLKNLLSTGTTSKSTLEARLTVVNTELTSLQTALNAANNTVITTVNATSAQPQTMLELHTVSSGSQKGLVTKGALLGFVSPASRISAIETCEGNVQLSYFDNQGRMRLTNYDATSDSRNTTFEQWLPDELPVALNFADSNDKIQLNNSIALAKESTIEAWFSYPLPQKNWNTLASSLSDTDQQVVVYQGKWLGTKYNGFFRSSGYNLQTLTSGWHHLAAVTSGSETQATTTFYIDGTKVGDVKTAVAALEFDGTNDYVEVAAHTNPTAAITVALWAKSNTDNWNAHGCLASKRNAYILNPFNGSKKIKFCIYVASEWKDVEYIPSDIKQWHHYAGTFDGMSLRLYIDGVEVASDDVFDSTTAFNSDNGALFIGKDDGLDKYFNGQIAEVSVWETARIQEQIQADMGKVLEGNESGLRGYWRFQSDLAKDLSSSPKNGTFHGEPKLVNSLATTTSSIQFLGNSQVGSQQFGKLSELRIWNLALKKEEIVVNSKTRLSGNEPGLIAYYPLNEATGTEIRDVTGSGNNGTVAGATWWGCTAPVGNLGHKVMEFDGTNDYVEVAPHTNPTTAITVALWAKSETDNWNANGCLASKRNAYVVHPTIDSKEIIFYIISDSSWKSVSHTPSDIKQWHHYAGTFDGKTLKLYIDGVEVASNDVFTTTTAINSDNGALYIGKDDGLDRYFKGQIAEVSVWETAHTQEQVQAGIHQKLIGKESGLVTYLPLDSILPEGDTQKVIDLSGNDHHGTVNGAIIKDSNTLPIGGNALISAEYSTIGIDPASNKKSAIMRRFLGSPALNGAELLPEKRIEQLELKWIGNAQFKPTLLGYMEGAPPIPSENLTVQDNYNGATSVELTMSENVKFSWNRSQDSGLGASIQGFVGAKGEISAGLGVETKIADWKAGFKGSVNTGYQWQNTSIISSGSTSTMSDRLELRGTQERDVKFSHLGKRFIPKNVGYALVVSGLADVFITRLKRTKRMIGYQVQPVDGIPLDVNTITFLINPAYTMNGSLDGMTGTSATSDRFYRHVPEMRAQYGSLYPASYYRLQEAYELKQKIDNDDKRRESYFAQFNAGSTDETSLLVNTAQGEAPTGIGVSREEDEPDENLSKAEKKAAKEKQSKQIEAESDAQAEKQSEAADKKQKEIEAKIEDQETRVHATESFAGWQKLMEAIQIRAGKRNIVNNYVWDADGGLRTEAQSFANTVQHTVGGSFVLDAAVGFQGEVTATVAAAELTALATINLTQTMNKTETRSKGLELNVDLSGVEYTGITDYNDYPIQPGEKVDRYRFMSFYLEGTTKNFNDFFSYVVDPEWLASNDEEARALRQAKGKANKTWRVLHRVTYVERPALMGFGQDTRKAKADDEGTEKMIDYFDSLEQKNKDLEDELKGIKGSLAELKTLLQNQQVSSNGGATSSSQTGSSTEGSSLS